MSSTYFGAFLSAFFLSQGTLSVPSPAMPLPQETTDIPVVAPEPQRESATLLIPAILCGRLLRVVVRYEPGQWIR